MSSSYVWFQLYYKGKDEPEGNPTYVETASAPFIGALVKAAKAELKKSLEHCGVNYIHVYSPGTDFMTEGNVYQPETNSFNPGDPVPTDTTPENPLIIVAPASQLEVLTLVSSGLSTNADRERLLSEPIPKRRPRIHGGWDTKEDRYSYAQVNLKWQQEGHQCGGSLVASDMVLTAAHCAGSFDKVEIGKYEKHDVTDASEEFDPDFETVHPSYDVETTRYDIMLVKLKGSSRMATPVRINKNDAVPSNGSMLTVIGMGYNANWNLPDVFQETDVRYQINDQCDDLVDEHGITLNGDLYPDMLCAGYDGRDSCYGDSGSPLVLKGASEQEDVQIGVVSWGYECAGTLPGIYSRLSHLPIYDFVEENVCLQSENPPEYMNCGKWSAALTTPPSKKPTRLPTQAPSRNPTAKPTPSPTQISFRSAAPTTERFREFLEENVYLNAPDLTLKTTNLEDLTQPTTPPEMSAAFCAFSCTHTDTVVITLISVLWGCILF